MDWSHLAQFVVGIVLALGGGPALTEVLKTAYEMTGADMKPFAAKAVNAAITWILGWFAANHIPFDLGPIFNLFAPYIVLAFANMGGQVLHDIATAVMKAGGITLPPTKAIVPVVAPKS